MSKVTSGPKSGQVVGESKKDQAGERGNGGWDHPVHGVGESSGESMLAERADGVKMVSIEDAGGAPLPGRTLVTFMLLNEEETAMVNKALFNEQAGLASMILGAELKKKK